MPQCRTIHHDDICPRNTLMSVFSLQRARKVALQDGALEAWHAPDVAEELLADEIALVLAEAA